MTFGYKDIIYFDPSLVDFVLQELKFTEEVLNILIPIAMKAIEGQLIDDRRFASSGSTASECCYLFRGESLQNI